MFCVGCGGRVMASTSVTMHPDSTMFQARFGYGHYLSNKKLKKRDMDPGEKQWVKKFLNDGNVKWGWLPNQNHNARDKTYEYVTEPTIQQLRGDVIRYKHFKLNQASSSCLSVPS
eukprot:335827-Rhodomonas_salina.1